MKQVLATCLLLAMTLSHGASALCGHRTAAAPEDGRVAQSRTSDHAAAGHHGSGPADEHHGSDASGEHHGSDGDSERDGHECGELMDCGVVAVAPSADGPSQWVGGSSFPLRHLTGSIESELPPTESPPPRQS
jgi:hypothetical protein